MNNDKALRDHILMLLKGGLSYNPFDEIVVEFPEAHINTLFPHGTYGPWDLLEHIRRTQVDILNFMIDPDYKEPSWPKDYWPVPGTKATKKEWDKTILQFKKDLQTLQELVNDTKIDLFAKVPHGSGQTFLREFLLVADHNSYHLGEFSIMRQAMKTWNKGRKG